MIFRKLVYSHLLFYFHGYEATMSVFTAGGGGRRKGRTAYTFQYSRTYILGSFSFDVFEFQEAGFVNWSDQVWFALSFASIIDREFLSVQRKNWTQNESSSFLLPVLVRTECYALITNIPQVSVTKTMQVRFLLTAHTHWWRALTHVIFTLRPQLPEAPVYGISQVSVTGNRAWKTIHGFFSASAQEAQITFAQFYWPQQVLELKPTSERQGSEMSWILEAETA